MRPNLQFPEILNVKFNLSCSDTNSTGSGRLSINETKLYVPIATLSTQDKQKLLQQL